MTYYGDELPPLNGKVYAANCGNVASRIGKFYVFAIYNEIFGHSNPIIPKFTAFYNKLSGIKVKMRRNFK